MHGNLIFMELTKVNQLSLNCSLKEMGPKKRPRPTSQSKPGSSKAKCPKSDSSEEAENLIICKVCKRSFPVNSILKHLNHPRSNGKCKQLYTDEEYRTLQEQSSKQGKVNKKVYLRG